MLIVTKKDLETIIKEMGQNEVDELELNFCTNGIDFDIWTKERRFVKTVFTLLDK